MVTASKDVIIYLGQLGQEGWLRAKAGKGDTKGLCGEVKRHSHKYLIKIIINKSWRWRAFRRPLSSLVEEAVPD